MAEKGDEGVDTENGGGEVIHVIVYLDIPKSISEFIELYCDLSRIRPSEFVRSSIMYALNDLIEEMR